ncbi:DDHD [Musa troglodytarum]|uniref:DDHD n=1 Tax=Musa troglodytarum TaxID=320322 RepID=A0A9E7FHY8_9LILI|nr:DDHD [Musa troglodytarum]
MTNFDERSVRKSGDVATSSSLGAPSSNPVERSSPDLLRNTPSNIATLEDTIEQFKSRQKYLAHTKSPSDGEDVRWYLCKVPLAEKQLSASLPRIEIVGKDDYFRFSIRDSLALEASFLQREEDLLAHWWKEYAECSKGPSATQTTNYVTSTYGSNELYVVKEERVGVPVKGGLYEVDLIKRHCFPVYWSGENRRVLRGHWFAHKDGNDWLPLREDVAEQLELAYCCQVWRRRTFQPSGQFAARIDLQGTTEGLHAIFTGDDDSWEAWLAFDSSSFSLNMGGGNRVKLRRGFSPSGSPKPSQDELHQQKEEAMDDYCSQVPVGHLVFMVHGIGQRLENANVVDDVADFHRITASLVDRHLNAYQRSMQRVLFIPCQWRRGLELSSEPIIEKITLDGVRGLRATLSATVHDVLYYMSPIYCQNIIDSVSNQLNGLYAKFLKRNPGYDGKISIFGHSLGSVLSYDILCHQDSSATLPVEANFVDDFCIPKQECIVNLQGQQHISVNGSSMSNPYTKVNEEKTPDVSCVEDCGVTRGQQEDFLCNDGIQESDDSAKLFSKNQHTNFERLDEVNKNVAETLYAEDRDSDANPGISRDFHGNEVRDARHPSEDLIDKGKLVSLLMEEVKSLKAKVAELEKNHHSAFCSSNFDNGSFLEVYHGKGQMIKSMTSSSSFGRFSSVLDDSKKQYTPYIKYTRLNFKVDTFFAVGSPLGVFLALRNVRIGVGRGQAYWEDEKISEEMPSCRQMFNIFHPFDPVAYRVEPLICKEFLNKRPVLIPYHRGGRRLHIGFQEFTEDIAARSQSIMSQLNSLRVKVASTFQLQNKDKAKETVEDEKKERSYGSFMIERLTGCEYGRIDFVLQEGTFNHPYLSAIGSHTNYWRDNDTALFVLNHLYHGIPEEPPTDDQKRRKDENCSCFLKFSLPLLFWKELLQKMPLWRCGLIPWMNRKVVDPFLQIIRKGAEPKQLAFSTALGMSLGLFPICGVTVFLCGMAIAILRHHCHAPSVMLANFVATPIELSLVIPFLRLGELITGGPHFPLTSDALSKVVSGQASQGVLIAILHAVGTSLSLNIL